MKNNMYIVIKNHIERGDFKITEIIPKIREEVWTGQISEAERDELIELAHNKVDPKKEAPEVMEIIAKLINRMDEMEEILKSLITPEQPETPENPETPDEPEIPVEPIYPEWKAWDGISKDYQKGAIVQHNNKLWESTFEGQNVWEPGIPGIDERYWVEYTPKSEEANESEASE